jgi:hypothetical protein
MAEADTQEQAKPTHILKCLESYPRNLRRSTGSLLFVVALTIEMNIARK